MKTESIAVIVGAGAGLGTALAKRFARENFTVALIARNKDHLQSLADDIKQMGGKAIAFSADVTQEEEVAATFNAIRQQGSIQVLIYNAASRFELKSICDISPSAFVDHWKITCLGGLLSAQQVIPDMQKQKQGTIIFSGATAALRGGAHLAGFAVGKFSQRALAQSMARELGPVGIHVAHVVIDGYIATPAVRQFFPDRPLDTFLNPDAIAETYWQIHCQHPTAWTQELDIRPAVEKF